MVNLTIGAIITANGSSVSKKKVKDAVDAMNDAVMTALSLTFADSTGAVNTAAASAWTNAAAGVVKEAALIVKTNAQIVFDAYPSGTFAEAKTAATAAFSAAELTATEKSDILTAIGNEVNDDIAGIATYAKAVVAVMKSEILNQ